MKRFITTLMVVAISLVSAQVSCAQSKSDKVNMLGLLGGVAFTSNPPALQKLTNKSHYVDGNGGLTYLYHNDVSDGYAFEWQLSMIGSSVSMLDHADDETKMKFIVPLDFRWFLGNNQKFQGYLGLGLQYNTVWLFTSGESSEGTYYDPWWGVYYTDTSQDEGDWDWTVNQLSVNLAMGFKVPFGEYLEKKHSCMLGLKVHFPIINSSEYHGNESSSVDLSKDKVCLSITGGVSFGFNNGNAIKIDGEYPMGGTSKYTLNDGGHATFFNSNTWSLSATFLFRLRI